MKITELLKKESVELNVKVSGKESAIDKLVDLMGKGGRLKDKAVYKEEILKREAHGSSKRSWSCCDYCTRGSGLRSI